LVKHTAKLEGSGQFPLKDLARFLKGSELFLKDSGFFPLKKGVKCRLYVLLQKQMLHIKHLCTKCFLLQSSEADFIQTRKMLSTSFHFLKKVLLFLHKFFSWTKYF